ncbi:MAG TPA: glycosyl hydrolase family 28 protein [Puia sp.]|jgi:polygalacturonase
MEKEINKNQLFAGRRSMIGQCSTAIGSLLLFSSFRNKRKPGKTDNSAATFDVKKYGATGRRSDNATLAFHDAIKACVARGGGLVNVPPGDYTVGTIELRDNMTLHIEAGATLFLSQSAHDFRRDPERSMIYAENAKNIAVTGKGTLNGLAQYDFTEMTGIDPDIAKEIDIAKAAGVDMRRYYRRHGAMNTYMFVLNDCINILLRDITVINSPLWNIRLNDCDGVHVEGVYIFSDLEKGVNADGIDIVSTSNVCISDSTFVTGDDSIVLKTISKNGKPAKPVENVTVTNCVLTSSSTPLMIGTETEADIRHVLFNNCVIRNSNKGFGINVQDGANVSDVIISNLTIETNRRHWNWWGDAEMCRFILHKRKPASKLGVIRDIIIDNIIAHTRGTSTITGHPDQPVENITMSNVQIFMNPENKKDKRCTDALKIENVLGLKIRDLTVKWSDETEEKWKSAISMKKVTDFNIGSFEGRQGLKNSEEPAIWMDDVSDGTIRDSRAAKGTGVFIRLSGKESKDIILRNNDTKKAGRRIVFSDEELKKETEIN